MNSNFFLNIFGHGVTFIFKVMTPCSHSEYKVKKM